jgi:hypothetical protein
MPIGASWATQRCITSHPRGNEEDIWDSLKASSDARKKKGQF